MRVKEEKQGGDLNRKWCVLGFPSNCAHVECRTDLRQHPRSLLNGRHGKEKNQGQCTGFWLSDWVITFNIYLNKKD